MQMKIDLEEITDNALYARVAFLVDNNDFLDEVARIRKDLGVDKLISYNKVSDWEKTSGKTSSLSKMSQKDKSTFNKSLRLGWEVDSLLRKFNRGYFFEKIIKYAILTGKVTHKECMPSAFCEVYPFSKEFEDAEFYYNEPMVAIFVNPETKIKEVEKMFKKDAQDLFKKSKRRHKKSNNVSTIKETRKMYWQIKSGDTYEVVSERESISIESLTKRMMRYRKKLASLYSKERLDNF